MASFQCQFQNSGSTNLAYLRSSLKDVLWFGITVSAMLNVDTDDFGTDTLDKTTAAQLGLFTVPYTVYGHIVYIHQPYKVPT